jgi:hypothetical protein
MAKKARKSVMHTDWCATERSGSQKNHTNLQPHTSTTRRQHMNLGASATEPARGARERWGRSSGQRRQSDAALASGRAQRIRCSARPIKLKKHLVYERGAPLYGLGKACIRGGSALLRAGSAFLLKSNSSMFAQE